MIVLVWIFAILWVFTACVAVLLLELLQKALQENIVLTIKANAPRITSTQNDAICHMVFADGTEYDVKIKGEYKKEATE